MLPIGNTDQTAATRLLARLKTEWSTDELTDAIWRGDAKSVATLAPQADGETRDADGDTLLHIACSFKCARNHAACVEALLPFCDPHAVDARGFSAFGRAVKYALRDVVELLADYATADEIEWAVDAPGATTASRVFARLVALKRAARR